MPRTPDFDEPEAVVPAKLRSGEPQGMTEEAQEIRRLWIVAVKQHYFARTGKWWDYRPGRQWDVGNGTNPKPIWPRLLAFLKEHHVMPALYFRAQFENADDLLQPNMVMNEGSLKRYREYLQRSRGNALLELKVQVQQFELKYYQHSQPGRSDADVLRMILSQPYTGLSPLFVYCYASRDTGLDDVVLAYANAALAQYLTDPDAYDSAWGEELIPSQLRQVATAYRTRIDAMMTPPS